MLGGFHIQICIYICLVYSVWNVVRYTHTYIYIHGSYVCLTHIYTIISIAIYPPCYEHIVRYVFNIPIDVNWFSYYEHPFLFQLVWVHMFKTCFSTHPTKRQVAQSPGHFGSAPPCIFYLGLQWTQPWDSSGCNPAQVLHCHASKASQVQPRYFNLGAALPCKEVIPWYKKHQCNLGTTSPNHWPI